MQKGHLWQAICHEGHEQKEDQVEKVRNIGYQ